MSWYTPLYFILSPLDFPVVFVSSLLSWQSTNAVRWAAPCFRFCHRTAQVRLGYGALYLWWKNISSRYSTGENVIWLPILLPQLTDTSDKFSRRHTSAFASCSSIFSLPVNASSASHNVLFISESICVQQTNTHRNLQIVSYPDNPIASHKAIFRQAKINCI